jgi:hypothetical protein
MSKTRKSHNPKKSRLQQTRKSRPLKLLWQNLADGKYLIVIPKKGKYYKVMKPTKQTYDELPNNPDVKAILTASLSPDSLDKLLEHANKYTVDDIIKKYKKFFLHYPNNEKVWYLK